MPKVTIDIPNRFMPTIQELATEKLHNIDTSQLTNAQIATKVVVRLLKEEVLKKKIEEAEIESRIATMELVNQERETLATTKTELQTDVEAIVESV